MHSDARMLIKKGGVKGVELGVEDVHPHGLDVFVSYYFSYFKDEAGEAMRAGQ